MEADMKEKLSSITENLDQAIQRISVDMTALVQEHMASMKQDLLHAAEARENQLISKLLTAMTSDDSPYAIYRRVVGE
jgi:Holliday junction resolvasome RuvABC endonuclease subunit